MTGRAAVLPQVWRDVVEIADYISRDSLDAAERFFDAAEAEFQRLADSPGLGALYPSDLDELQRVRYWPIKGFRNYLIFYRATSDGIDVLRVIHGSRNIESLFL